LECAMRCCYRHKLKCCKWSRMYHHRNCWLFIHKASACGVCIYICG
jgi:hypothetical protein